MIVRQTRFYRLAEFFFDEESQRPDVDVIEHFQRSRPIPGARCRDSYTHHLDLTQDPQTLFSAFSPTCQYQIRRAERDELKEEAWMSARDDLADDFIAFFNRWARGKGLPPAPAERLRALTKAGVLDLSTVTRHDDTLVWHAYLRAGNRARLLHSASLFREHNDTAAPNMIGRANRYLHWHDLLRYKDAGIALFDFGGWYGKDEDERLRISAFHESFGGRVVPEFHCAVPTSTRGRMVMFARRLRNR
ncbi:MAG: GNAT family N-acetyltransferase [Actinomycetota bacterium]|nr:GNAT family N-acetyltransferase [Actinomycetota bacterium]